MHRHWGLFSVMAHVERHAPEVGWSYWAHTIIERWCVSQLCGHEHLHDLRLWAARGTAQRFEWTRDPIRP